MDKISIKMKKNCDVDAIESFPNITDSKFQLDFKNIECNFEEIPLKRERKKTKIFLEMSNYESEIEEIINTPHKEIFELIGIESKDTDNNDLDFNVSASTSTTKKRRGRCKKPVSNEAVVTDLKSQSKRPKLQNKDVSKTGDTVVDGIELKIESKLCRHSVNKISPELKKMIIDAMESGVCNRKSAAAAFNLPYATVVTIYKKFLRDGSIGRKKKEEKIQEEQLQFILDTLAENCTYTIKELTEMVKEKYSIDVHYVSVGKKIPAFHYNLNRMQPLTKIETPNDIIDDHREYCQLFLELCNSGRPIIYFDETDFTILMRRFCGRTEPGQKGHATAPSMRTRHRTIMVSMNKDEILLYKTFADPRTRSDLFLYLKELFDLLTARQLVGAVIVLGNGAFTYCEDIKDIALIEGHQLLFLPAQSASFNPVESLFSQWPGIIRIKDAKNESQLEQFIDDFSELVYGKQLTNYCQQSIDNCIHCVNGTLVYQ